MVICAVYNCKNRSDRDSHLSYFKFPRVISNRGIKIQETSLKRLKVWLLRISRADMNDSNIAHKRVCSEHFIKGKPSNLLDETNPDWAPSLKLGHSRYKADGDQETERCVRTVNSATTPIVCHVKRDACEKSVQTDMDFDALLVEIKKLKHENAELRQLLEVSKSYIEDTNFK